METYEAIIYSAILIGFLVSGGFIGWCKAKIETINKKLDI